MVGYRKRERIKKSGDSLSRTFFAYHLTHVFGPFGLDSYHTNSDKPSEGDLVYVVSGNADETAAGVDYSLEGIFRIRRRMHGPYMLRAINEKPRQFKFKLSMEPVHVPDSPVSLANTALWYDRREVHRFFSSGQNFNPLPTQPDYKTRFDELLAGYAMSEDAELILDLAELERSVPDQTERDVLAKARIGQGVFRAGVVRMWRRGETCSLTGLDVPEMLVASHIRPWRDATNGERLDPANGLLLGTHADKLFDRYLLSFRQERGQFMSVLHPRVRRSVSGLGLREGISLRSEHVGFANARRLEQFMAEHHSRFQQRVLDETPTY